MSDLDGEKVLEHATLLAAWRKPDKKICHFAMSEETVHVLKTYMHERQGTDQTWGGPHGIPDEPFKCLGLEIRLDDNVPYGMVELRQHQEDNDA